MARRAKARELLDRSRVALDRSRVAAAQFLDPPRHAPPERKVIEAAAPSGEVPADDGAPLVDICASIALRDLNLVDSLLSQLEEMEAKEDDGNRLGQLYQLDHLAARLRRNAENLRVLAGRDASDAASDTASLVDIMRAAMSSIDQYDRITIGRVASLGVVGFAAEDLSRLLAELLDNAANQSPPSAAVRVSAHLTEQGSVLVRVEDEGIGLPPERISELNERLSGAPVLDDAAVRHMGLAVVRRLAGRHDMRVTLDRRLPHGTTATVLIPTSVVCELPEASWSGGQTVVTAPASRTALVPSATQPTQPESADENAGAAEGPAGLPKRNPSSATATRPRPAPVSSVGGVTESGLPRRVSRSLKNPTGRESEETASAVSGELTVDDADDAGDGHDKLLADLGAFADGEQAALDEQRGSAGSGHGEADPSSKDDQ